MVSLSGFRTTPRDGAKVGGFHILSSVCISIIFTFAALRVVSIMATFRIMQHANEPSKRMMATLFHRMCMTMTAEDVLFTLRPTACPRRRRSPLTNKSKSF